MIRLISCVIAGWKPYFQPFWEPVRKTTIWNCQPTATRTRLLLPLSRKVVGGGTIIIFHGWQTFNFLPQFLSWESFPVNVLSQIIWATKDKDKEKMENISFLPGCDYTALLLASFSSAKYTWSYGIWIYDMNMTWHSFEKNSDVMLRVWRKRAPYTQYQV